MAMCTQPAVSPPVGYKHQSRQAILHQSEGGKQGVDRLQQEAPLRVWSERHRGLNKIKEEGGKSLRFEEDCDFLLKGEERRRNRCSGFFARNRSAGRTQRGERAKLKQWRLEIFVWS